MIKNTIAIKYAESMIYKKIEKFRRNIINFFNYSRRNLSENQNLYNYSKYKCLLFKRY